jgi:hypothetical protein
VGKSGSFTVFHPSDSIQKVGAIVFKLAAVNSRAAKLYLLLRGTKTGLVTSARVKELMQ